MLVACRGGASRVLRAQASATGQADAGRSFTLEQALQYAVDHYPTVRAALEQINASTAGVSVAKSAYLPRLDSLWQSNRGTVNNIFGQVLPQSVIPAMSGPVLAVGVRPAACGGARPARCSPGSRSTSVFVRPAWPAPRPRSRARAPARR